MKTKFGIGTISLLFLLLGYLTTQFRSSIVAVLNLPTLQNSGSKLDFTVLYSFIFFIPAIIIGSLKKYNQDFGSKLGRNVSLIVVIVTTVTLLLVPMIFK